MSKGFCLISGSPADTALYMHRLLVRMAIHGPVRWLMCERYVDLQRLIYDVVLRAGEDYYSVLETNIAIIRAETCYQVVAALRKIEPARTPIFISNPLMYFYDEKIRETEATELFIDSVQSLNLLSQAGPVIVSGSSNAGRPQFYATLLQNARRVSYLNGGGCNGS
jgi:hypothetical protein